MLRVLILLHDANNHGRTRVLEELHIINDGTGDSERGNYDVTRFSDNGVIDTTEIRGFERYEGAFELTREAMELLA